MNASSSGHCAPSVTTSRRQRRCPAAVAPRPTRGRWARRSRRWSDGSPSARAKSDATTALISEADNLQSDFIRLVDDDSAAYARVSEAMKLPKASDEEKRARTERIQASLLAASRVPLEVAKTSRRLLDLCERTVHSAASATVSDVGVGALLAETALRGAALNVMINLASVKDASQVKALSEDLDRAVDGAEAQRTRITDFVESRIAR